MKLAAWTPQLREIARALSLSVARLGCLEFNQRTFGLKLNLGVCLARDWGEPSSSILTAYKRFSSSVLGAKR